MACMIATGWEKSRIRDSGATRWAIWWVLSATGQAGADVEELADAVLAREPLHRLTRNSRAARAISVGDHEDPALTVTILGAVRSPAAVAPDGAPHT
jgi:hypothetical protein